MRRAHASLSSVRPMLGASSNVMMSGVIASIKDACLQIKGTRIRDRPLQISRGFYRAEGSFNSTYTIGLRKVRKYRLQTCATQCALNNWVRFRCSLQNENLHGRLP